MKEIIKQLLRENPQLADKVYFNSGKLSPRVREIILHITNGDPYTKLMTDIYYTMLINGHRTGEWAMTHIDPTYQETENPQNDVMGMNDLKKLRPIYNQLKNYNKNVFPIKGFNINGIENINDFLWALEQREKIISIFNEWPSIAKRNMKADIKIERDGSEINLYRDLLEHADAYLSQLNNRNEEARNKILAKIFTNNTTLDNVTDFLYNKESLLGGVDMTRKQIGQILKYDKENADELKVKYNKGNIMIIEVSGPDGIKEIGCNSLWCFTYNRKGGGTNWNDWYKNSTNDYCYIIIDFSESSDSEDFMHVLTKPLLYDYSDYRGDAERLYNMANRDMGDYDDDDEIYNNYINQIVGGYLDLPTAMNIMNFGVQPPKEKKNKQKFVDPAQYSLELNETKKLIKNILRESLLLNEIRFINPNRQAMENEPPLRDNDTIRVYHGFNNYQDAIMAVKFGLSGQEKARRIYSYESNNNPNGLFVTLDYKIAEKFSYPSGDRGIKVVMELSVKVSDLEAPVWPSGSYTVQGQMAQFWKDDQDRYNNGTLKAREEAKNSKLSFISGADRPEVAEALYSYEAQALFVGNLNPNMIKNVFFGESGKHGYNPDRMSRISTQDFLNKFISHEPEKNYDGRITDKGEQYHKKKNMMFNPNDDFDFDKFNQQSIENDWDKTGLDMLKDLDKYKYLNHFFWPKQINQIKKLLEIN